MRSPTLNLSRMTIAYVGYVHAHSEQLTQLETIRSETCFGSKNYSCTLLEPLQTINDNNKIELQSQKQNTERE